MLRGAARLLVGVPLVVALCVVDGAADAEDGAPGAVTQRAADVDPVDPAVEDPGPVELDRSQVRLRKLPGGTSVVRGTGPVFGTKGRIIRYTVEVQTRMPREHARAIELEAVSRWAFGDTERGWTARGERRMQRVGKVGDAKIRVVLARPSNVNKRCRNGGANTAGVYSCFNGKVAALNKLRWRTGSQRGRFDSLDQYRLYLVNHEVGHGLGYGHKKCPRKGELARVMLPQSRKTYGCRANGWPYP